ncbi:hypothetical protein K4F52_008026 [Lecanicillium sp. MT-2017a]|nr:hypothetical protein K4F52_008026 [Lecanicillium sp. MT-2017a]
MAAEGLNVIALISGGKDSFFSLLHCIDNGHKIVALANLYPQDDKAEGSNELQVIDPHSPLAATGKFSAEENGEGETDLNSFMYQTVGHEVIPLYAAATGLPLYRQPILGGAVRHERDYAYNAAEEGVDETESMIPLLQAIKKRHPEANALCSGAILSTYQRTRVESIALRLGLTPLAYLWKYTVLPPPITPANDAQLLLDMAEAGLEARIIKVASAGLGEDHLWELASSHAGAAHIQKALRKFGATEGAALGEGGEFETLVLDGPSALFKRRIAVPDDGKAVIQEGGGSTWLHLRGSHIVEKPDDNASSLALRRPNIFDTKFQQLMEGLASAMDEAHANPAEAKSPPNTLQAESPEMRRWSIMANESMEKDSIQDETISVVRKFQHQLELSSTDPSQITSIIIILRNMADFPKVNQEYGKLFTLPNPPSRVTISCGELLPAGRNILLHATAPARPNEVERNGLHVQSRSYWAPANIGPYSQAVEVPFTANGQPVGPKGIYIAGQIPLVPNSMLLPEPSATSAEEQVVLSLQHLWRIGSEMKVQWWTSAVAYFSKSVSPETMPGYARLAGRAWSSIHQPSDEDDDDANGPDPWDLKYNPQYMLLGSNESAKPRPLPDWEALPLGQQNEPDSCIPPVFAAEVEELPRQSSVEWHAHVGLSGIEQGSAEVASMFESELHGWRAWHMLVQASGAVVIHTTLACVDREAVEKNDFDTVAGIAEAIYTQTVGNIGVDAHGLVPYLMYTGPNVGTPWNSGGESNYHAILYGLEKESGLSV